MPRSAEMQAKCCRPFENLLSIITKAWQFIVLPWMNGLSDYKVWQLYLIHKTRKFYYKV